MWLSLRAWVIKVILVYRLAIGSNGQSEPVGNMLGF